MDVSSGNNPNPSVPGFLSKLWLLVEDVGANELIEWGPNGSSFIVHDQIRFAKEILPRYFKHSNMASFIRQLNMYGFRKKTNIEHGSLKADGDEIEFQHQFFQRGKTNLLEQIKRKISAREESKLKIDDVQQILTDVKDLKGKQDNITGTLDTMQRDNQVLWREVIYLRQRHEKQQKIVNRLIQFLITMVKPVSMKRKQPQLMIEPPSDEMKPKYPRLANPGDSCSQLANVQPIASYDTDLDNLPCISDLSTRAILSDVTGMLPETLQQSSTNDGYQASTAAAFGPSSTSGLDPSLYDLEMPPMMSSDGDGRESRSPVITSPDSLAPSTASLLTPGIEEEEGLLIGGSMWPEPADDYQGNKVVFPPRDDDHQLVSSSSSGLLGSGDMGQAAFQDVNPGSRVVLKRMLSHDEHKSELGEHVNSTQENLDMIQSLLSSLGNPGSFNIDMDSLLSVGTQYPDSLLSIFNLANGGNTTDMDAFQALSDNSSLNTTGIEQPLTGTELVQYVPHSVSPFTADDEDSLLQSLNDDSDALERLRDGNNIEG